MSQIKKLQPGGIIPDRTEAKKALWDKFYTLSTKDQKRAQEQYKQVESLLDLPDFEKIVKFNPDRTYSIDVSKLPSNLQQKDWSGHQGLSVDKGFLGLQGYTHANIFSNKQDRDEEIQNKGLSSAMADLSNIVSQKNTNSQIQSQEVFGKHKIIPEFTEFISEKFNNKPQVAAEHINALKEPDKAKFYIDNLGNLLNSYKTNYDTNKATNGKDTYDEKDVVKVNDAIIKFNDLKTKGKVNLEDYNEIFHGLGISTSGLLKSPEVVKAENEVSARISNLKDMSTKTGINENILSKYYDLGFKKIADGYSQNTTDINNHLKSKGAIVLDNGFGKKIILNNKTGDIYQEDINDQFSPLYGKKITFNDNQLSFIDKFNPTLQNFGDIGKQLKITNPEYTGYNIYGWSDGKSGDYLQRLQFKDPKGIQQWMTRVGRNQYKDSQGNVKNINLTGFGNEQITPENWDIPLEFKPLGSSNHFDLNTSLEKATSIITSLVDQNNGKDYEGTNEIVKVIKSLNYAAMHTTDHNEKVKVLKTLSTIRNLMGDQYKQYIELNKNGGVLKVQGGAKLDSYLNKYATPTTVQTKSKTKGKFKDISGTWKGQSDVENGLDAVSIAGTVGSFIPGWGALGAGVTLGADLIKEATQHGADLSSYDGTKLGIDAAFVALSFIGLGGLKALVKSGKAVDAVMDTAQLTTKAKKLGILGKESLEAEKAIDNIGRLTSIGKNTALGIGETSQILKNSGKEANTLLKKLGYTDELIAQNKNLSKEVAESLDFGTRLVAEASPFAGSKVIGRFGQRAGNTISNLAEKTAKNKFLKYGVAATAAVPGAIAIPKIIDTAYNEGIEYTNLEDVRSALILGSLGNNLRNELKTIKAIKRQATPGGTKDLTEFTVGEGDALKKIEISGAHMFDDSKSLLQKGKAKIGVGKESAEKTLLEKQDKFKQTLADAYEKTSGIKLTPEEIKSINLENVKATRGIKSGEWFLSEKPLAKSKSLGRDEEDWYRAKKYLEKYQKTANIQSSTKESIKGEAEKASKETVKKLNIKLTQKGRLKLQRKKDLNNSWKEYQDNIVEHKLGGIVKFAKPAGNLSYKPLKNLSIPTISVKSNSTVKYPLQEQFKINTESINLPKSIYTSLGIPKPIENNIILNSNDGSSHKVDNSVKIDLNKLIKNIDVADLGNAGMYLNTLAANKKITNKQIAAANVIDLKTLQPGRNITIYNPTDRLSEKAKTDANSFGNKLANNYSDSSKQIAVQLAMYDKGEKSAADYRAKGTELYNKGIQAQNDADYTTLVNNRNTQDWNMASINKGIRQSLGAEANLTNANNAALTNFIHGSLKNIQAKKLNKDYSELINMQTGDEYKTLRNLGESLPLEENKAKEFYNKNKTSGDVIWEDSDEYKSFQNKYENYKTRGQLYSDKMRLIQTKLSYPTRKKGGSLTKQDRIDIENTKHNNKRGLEEEKLFYKVIAENNKLMQKSLMQIFK